MAHHGVSAIGQLVHHGHAAYASGAGNWFAHALMSGVIHAVVYRMIAPLFRGEGVAGSLIIGVALIALAYIVWRASRRRMRAGTLFRP